jgi:single-stranded DNA-binding protein
MPSSPLTRRAETGALGSRKDIQTKFASSLKKGDPVLVQGELRTGEYTDVKKVTRQTVELVAQTILRIDYTKIGITEQGNAAEPGAKRPPRAP